MSFSLGDHGLPLTAMQEGMLFHQLSGGGQGVDIEQISLRIGHVLDEPAFVEAWNDLLPRYGILRTAFSYDNGSDPVQIVRERVKMPVARLDWRSLTGEDWRARLEKFVSDDRLVDFDLAQPPLMRLVLIRLPENVTFCLWTFHHILLDGRSFRLVLQDLFELYEARCSGKTADLPYPRQFDDFLVWSGKRVDDGEAEFWRNDLIGVHGPLPLRFGAKGNTGRAGYDFCQSSLEADETDRLYKLARDEGVTVHTLLQTAWALLLHHYTREVDIVFGSTRACRHSSVDGVDRMVGLLINTVPFRVKLDDKITFKQLLQQIRSRHIAIRKHEHTPLKTIRKLTGIASETLFDSLLVFENLPLREQMHRLGGHWEERLADYRGQTNLPLALIAYGGEHLSLRLEYDCGRYDDDFMANMLGHLKILLRNFCGSENDTAITVPYLSDEEVSEMLSEQLVNNLSAEKALCLHTLFEHQAELRPESVALSFEDRHYSYRKLNGLANSLAMRLIDQGVEQSDFVGLCFPRSAELIIALLAILKTGAAYVPLDPAYPQDRLSYIVDDARLKIVIGDIKAEKILQACETKVVLANGLQEAGMDANPSITVPPESVCYVIYTSGSTGQPKGVKVRHNNVDRLFHATRHWYDFDENDVWSLFHSTSFDFSVWEIWGALVFGGRLVVVPYWVSRSPEDFYRLVRDEKVTVLNQTPSAFRQFMEVDQRENNNLSLRYVIFGGEALALQDLRYWFERHGDERPRLVNMYGITETTVHVTYRPITLEDLNSSSGSVIGAPIKDLYIVLLDDNMRPVPVGVVGEMYVGGAGVADGYLNRDELTRSRFIRNPFGSDDVLYKTGDLARRHTGGELEYIGRSDSQVKIRGFRIETGEIEIALNQHEAIRQSIVDLSIDSFDETRLVAYLRCVDNQVPSMSELREFLSQTLPDYMIPALLIPIDEIPLTHNGKIDKKALPEPMAGTVRTDEFVPAQNEQQALLVDIWSKILGVEKVGVNDSFFDLGGDSILTIKIVAALRDAGYRLSPRQIFNAKTIAAVAECLEPMDLAIGLPDTLSGPIPMLPAQRWFFEHDFAQPNYWNQAFLFDLKQPIKLDLLQQSIVWLAGHHDILRARYCMSGQSWKQAIDESLSQDVFSVIDLASENPASINASLQRHCTQAQASLDITGGLVFRFVYFMMPEGSNKLFVCAHHLLVDGVSWGILLADLESTYKAFLASRTVVLPACTASVKAWSEALSAYVASDKCRENMRYWKDRPQPDPCSKIKRTDSGGTEDTAHYSREFLDKALTEALLMRSNRAYNTRINDLLLSALLVAMQQWCGQSKLVVELEGHGREDLFDRIDISRTVGWFTSIFPVYLELDTQAPLKWQLQSVKEQLRALPNNGLDYLASRFYGTNIIQAEKQTPDILFNYLGQFDQTVNGLDYLSFAEQDSGPWHGPGNRRTHAIEWVTKVQQGRLVIDLYSDNLAVTADDHQQLLSLFRDALVRVIQHCGKVAFVNHTPADFPFCGLSQSRLDILTSRYQIEDICPLSPMQGLFYTADMLSSANGIEQWRFLLNGPLNAGKYRAAWQSVVNRHAILRTAIATVGDSEPVQVVCKNVNIAWREHDLTGQPADEQQRFIQQLLLDDQCRHFELDKPSLLRLNLLKIAEDQHELIWSTHHLCIDGWSWPLVFSDLTSFYTDSGLTESGAPPFADYIRWLGGQDTTAVRQFWKKELQGFQNPIIFARKPVSSVALVTRSHHSLDEPTSAQLRALSTRAGVTLNCVFQALWAAVLGQSTHVKDVVFGISTSGRPPEIPLVESIVGPFVNNIPKRIRFDCNGEEASASLGSWLQTIQDESLRSLPYELASPVEVQQCSPVPLSSRLFESILVFQNYQLGDGVVRLGQDISVSSIELPQTTNYPLTLVVRPQTGIQLEGYFHEGYFDAVDVDALWADIDAAILAFIESRDQLSLALAFVSTWAPQRRESASRTSSHVVSDMAQPKVTEQIINRIWSNVFGVESVDPDKSFFAMGGQSVQLVSMHARIEQRLKRKFPIALFFKYPTVRALTNYFDGKNPASSVSADLKEKARLKKLQQMQKKKRIGK